MGTQRYIIESSLSNVDWTGRKVSGSHNGTIDIKAGSLTLDGGKLVGGNFIIDTTSIKILDVTDSATNAQFAGHLASDDFFASEKFPIATFEITAVTSVAETAYHIDGNLTIKGITEPVTFDATMDICSGELTANGKIVVDRTKYGMRYRSGNFFKDLGDNLIYNFFDLNVFITAKPV